MANTRLLTALLLVGNVNAKGPCQDYFGPMDDAGNLTTVVDPDVTQGFPFAYKTFVHHTGPSSQCLSPGPPLGCHRYYVVQYRGCALPCPLADGSAARYAGAIDKDGHFDRANGVLKSCAACARSVDIQCFQAPASEPTRCSCPGSTQVSVPMAMKSFAFEKVEWRQASSSTTIIMVGVLAAIVGFWAGRYERKDRNKYALLEFQNA